jgi:DNA-binding MarR family transcriptional regulator
VNRPTVTKSALMPGGNDDRFRGFIHDLLALSGQVDQLREGFGAHMGLSGTGYVLLMTLRRVEAGGPVGVSRLAEHLRLSGTFVTTEIAKLVKGGLVAKGPHGQDRRRVLLTVTAAGHARLDGLTPVQARVNDVMFGGFDGAEFLALAGIVERLVQAGDDAVSLLHRLLEEDGRTVPRGARPDVASPAALHPPG